MQLLSTRPNVLEMIAVALTPTWKHLFYRPMTLIHRMVNLQGPLATNLGLASGLEIRFSQYPGDVYAFGTPMHHNGERGALHLCKTFLEQADGFVDIGANRGLYTFASALWRRDNTVPIVSIEPVPALAEQLQSNIQRNQLNAVEVLTCAVADTVGQAQFNLDCEDPALSSLIGDSGRNQIEFTSPVETLDSILGRMKQSKSIIVKIDVEDAEHLVFKGLQTATDKVLCFIVEVCLPGQRLGTVAKVCARLDLFAYYINDFHLEYGGPDANFEYQHGQYNWLLCRLDPNKLRALLKGTRFQVRDLSSVSATRAAR
jgi:FkbM family methyltransferase